MRDDSAGAPCSAEFEHLLAAVSAELAVAGRCRQRRTLVLSGQREQGVALAQRLVKSLELGAHWHSDQAPGDAPTVFADTAFSLLGSEIDALVYDAYAGFDPDTFGALSGSIRAGGLLVLIIPLLDAWPGYNDPQNQRICVAPYSPEMLSGRFLRRLAALLGQDTDSFLVVSGRLQRQPGAAAETTLLAQDTAFTEPCKTADQQRAVDALMRVATGHRRRPVVLTSDRGRGKSAAFGIAAAQLLERGKRRIIVTAPREQSLSSLFEQAERLQAAAGDRIEFMSPDRLLAESPAADLVLVDEAAAIPTPILEGLLKGYARIAFATTVHGYEGTGRGFALRFSRMLDRHSNSWKNIELTTPIRWSNGDPLEALTFRLLALDAEPATVAEPAATAIGDFSLERLDRDALVEDETTLSQLFGLLVQAHYRTRPLDLRHLLDGPNLDVYVYRDAGQVVATALVASEGGFDRTAAEAIWAGRHRPHGHLLPETLAAHQGLRDAPLFKCGRIMRVTVHPLWQRRGLGSQLIRDISERLRAGGYDFIGTSFGASPELLAFWHQLSWRPVRLSIQKSASSGSHSAVFIKAFSARARALEAKARQRFFAQFPHQLCDSLNDLDSALVAAMLAHSECFAPDLDDDDKADLQAFAYQQRLAEVTIGSLWRLALAALMNGRAQARLDETSLALLIVRVLQKHDWKATVQRCGLSGRRQALSVLRTTVRNLLA